MDILCDTNIPPSLISQLKQDTSFNVENVNNLFSGPVRDSQVLNYVRANGHVLLTADHSHLKSNYSFGVLYYQDQTASDRRVTKRIETILSNNHNSRINEVVP
jgi:predicted O-linked N-acetylglucosamine transferase (SPINDLY family)